MTPQESDAVRAALRWLVGGGHPATHQSLVAYYARPSHRHGIEGAAEHMLRRLYRAGYVESGKVTKAGKRAAQ